GKLLRNEPN
ncbi:unnamed protein product, partial [Rotaria sordida]